MEAGHKGQVKAITLRSLSEPFLQDHVTEKARLLAAGCSLAQLGFHLQGPAKPKEPGVGPLRIWPGGLCVSRSIGDVDAGPEIVPLPHIKQVWMCEWYGADRESRVCHDHSQDSVGCAIQCVWGSDQFWGVQIPSRLLTSNHSLTLPPPPSHPKNCRTDHHP